VLWYSFLCSFASSNVTDAATGVDVISVLLVFVVALVLLTYLCGVVSR
jgi:hypothetical protein